MGKTVWKKLRSRKGASLTFALLAFLVCAVISAVLLASASAAAGRGANIAETDQRYYAVTSAAELLTDSLKDQCRFGIRREMVHEDVVETTYTYNAVQGGYEQGTVDREVSNNASVSYYVGTPADTNPAFNLVENSNTMNESIWTELALYYVFGNAIYGSDTGYTDRLARVTFGDIDNEEDETEQYHTVTELARENRPHTWELSIAVTGYDYLSVNATIVMDEDGNLLVTVTNDDEDKAFPVVIKLVAEVRSDSVSDVDSDWDAVPPESEFADYTFTEDSTTTQTETTWITWTVAEVKKGK